MSQQSFMNRRALLKTFGLGAVGLAVGSQLGTGMRASAQDAAPAARASAFYTQMIGDLELTVIQEAKIGLDASLFGLNAEAGAAAALLTENNLPSPAIDSTVNISLIRSGDRLALVDAGLGDFPFPGSSANRLIPTLALLGIAPTDITDLIITHFHPDHLGGISSMDGVVAFPNAVHHIHSVELNFLKNTSGTPLDDFINAANGRLQPIEAASQLQTFEADAELLPGVFAVHTPGHTPGHIALRLSSGDAQAMATLDVANHVVLALSRPDWYFGFDADPAAAVETRKSVFGMLADEKIQVVGYHFPFPGVGMIARDGEGFRYFGA